MTTEKKPLLSVIVPIFNVEHYLSKCLDSLVNQGYDNYEIIMVNDCSTDRSAQIAEAYMGLKSCKCILVNHEENGGLSVARNTGILHASGEWITFVDSDDWVSEDYLTELYQTAVDNHAEIVIGGVDYVYDGGDVKSADSYGNLKNGASKKEIIAQCRSYACGRLFKKQLFIHSGISFPADIRRSEDICTIIPIMTIAENIAICEKTVYFYYQRSSSLSLSNKNLDLSFYPKTVKRMIDLSANGYETEIEFRVIHELLYGMVYLMIISHKSHNEFITHVDCFNSEHKDWEKNPYLLELPKAKQVFIKCAGHKRFILLKLLVFTKNILKR